MLTLEIEKLNKNKQTVFEDTAKLEGSLEEVKNQVSEKLKERSVVQRQVVNANEKLDSLRSRESEYHAKIQELIRKNSKLDNTIKSQSTQIETLKEHLKGLSEEINQHKMTLKDLKNSETETLAE